jgi:hypothetical protein
MRPGAVDDEYPGSEQPPHRVAHDHEGMVRRDHEGRGLGRAGPELGPPAVPALPTCDPAASRLRPTRRIRPEASPERTAVRNRPGPHNCASTARDSSKPDCGPAEARASTMASTSRARYGSVRGYNEA